MNLFMDGFMIDDLMDESQYDEHNTARYCDMCGQVTDHPLPACPGLRDDSPTLYERELWGVLNAIRVAVRFNNKSLNEDLKNMLPRLDEVLAKADSQKAYRTTPPETEMRAWITNQHPIL